MPLDVKILDSLNGRLAGFSRKNEFVLNFPDQNTQIVRGAARKVITSAQVLALNATPITVVPAPGAGLITMVERWGAYKAAGTAYAGVAAGEDLVLKYTDGSGVVAATPLETTGFVDQATAQTRWANGHATGDGATPGLAIGTAQANAAIVAQLLVGEITTGNSDLVIVVHYAVVPAVL